MDKMIASFTKYAACILLGIIIGYGSYVDDKTNVYTFIPLKADNESVTGVKLRGVRSSEVLDTYIEKMSKWDYIDIHDKGENIPKIIFNVDLMNLIENVK